jgi:hypothetical protein
MVSRRIGRANVKIKREGRMMDIFEFWSQIKRGETVHPADRDVFARINLGKHGFQLDCLPACYGGVLKTAPVVFLYLSPGYSAFDVEDAQSEAGKDYCLRKWTGEEPFRDYGPGKAWLRSRTKNYAEYEIARHSIATLNIGAYHSKDVKDYGSLLALPSSRVSLSWAQAVLFPQAERGERIVVCMRSAAYWGLEIGRHYGNSLFAPEVNRGGHLLKNDMNGSIRELIQHRLKHR